MPSLDDKDIRFQLHVNSLAKLANANMNVCLFREATVDIWAKTGE